MKSIIIFLVLFFSFSNFLSGQLFDSDGDARVQNKLYLRPSSNPVINGEYIWNSDGFSLGLFTNHLRRLTVKNDGKVGIGTFSPAIDALLHVNGNIRVADDADIFGLDEIVGFNDLRFSGDGSRPADMIIKPDGHVGIGTTITGASQFTLQNTNSSTYISTFLGHDNALRFLMDNKGATGINEYASTTTLNIKGDGSHTGFLRVKNSANIDKLFVGQQYTEVTTSMLVASFLELQPGNFVDKHYRTLELVNPLSPTYRWIIGPQTQLPMATDNDLYFSVWRGGTNYSTPAFIQDSEALTQMNFTGQHRSLVKDINFKDQDLKSEDLEGLIVVSDQNEYMSMSGGLKVGKDAIMTDESLPVVSLSKRKKDKSVFGVISSIESANRRDEYGSFVTPHDKEEGDQRVYINSVGEGAVWIIDEGGELEAGDYVVTSDIPGYGMRQEGEFLANYTVAKITMDCTFDPPIIPKRQIKKEKRSVEEQEIEVNILDDYGRIIWEPICDSKGNAIMEQAYKMRYLLEDGTRISKSEYEFRKGQGEKVYRAAFVGCTYHCG